jgi:hypothetical protein
VHQFSLEASAQSENCRAEANAKAGLTETPICFRASTRQASKQIFEQSGKRRLSRRSATREGGLNRIPNLFSSFNPASQPIQP